MEFSKKYIILILILFSLLYSCANFRNENEEKQVLPDFDFIKIDEIIVEFQDSNKKHMILDTNRIKTIQKFFLDSSNYVSDRKIKFDGEKSNLSFKVINNKDTLTLDVYPTRYDGIIELGFLDKFDPKDKWKFRKFNRFYMDDKLLIFLKE